MLNRIQNKNFIRKFSPNGRYLVGVSGGRDSVALFHFLVASGYKKLIVCHLNHQLRGRASEADARFVAKLAAKYGVDFELGSTTVRRLAAKKKVSVEVAAREARYKFFAEMACNRKCKTIFLAHHADDLAETFLINLFRGSGTAGLGAIREVSERRVDHVDLTIVRPLLGCWRSEIDAYVRKYRLKFREDASNKSLASLRNRLRQKIVPYLERTLGRNIRQSIWRAAMIAAEEENWIESQLPNARDADLGAGASAKAALPVAKLREMPVALQRREILKWLRTQNIANVGFDVVESVRSLLDHNNIAKINVPRDRHVRRRAGKVFVE